MNNLTKKAGWLLMGAGWFLILVVNGVEPFSAAVYGAEWPLKKVKLEKKQEPAAPEFKSGVSQKNLLKLSRPSPASLPFARVSTAATVDTLRILALRVEFQKETPDDPTTTGLGVFDRRTQPQFFAAEGHLVDPAPHDKNYFESHLEALDRFYQAVSNGKLKLAGEVWPPVDSEAYQLPNLHNYYGSGGPYADSAIVVQISRFFQDAVRLADSVSPQIDFSAYQSIIVFHAGSSRQDDIVFNTPNDFFTGFLVLGGSDVFTVDTGLSVIRDGLILPESPSQDNRVVGLNASLAHEFGHQLGLVDLYNTRTLITQVGDFSMMDNNGADVAVELDFRPSGGQLVLASSLLPVYPDAWSRAFLGFVDSMVVTRGPLNLSVLAAELQQSGTDVVKIPVSEQEYFLVENRAVELDTFPPVLKVDSFTNVVLGPARPDASGSAFTFEYDVLLPGSGLLIWHVDEGVAFLDDDGDGCNNFDCNTVNTDFRRRFLELKEADGLVDFGGNYFTGTFGLSEDMYRAGNNTSFTPSSNPSSRGKFGGQTGISVTSIGPADTLMNLSISSNYLLPGWPQFTGFFTMKQPPALGDLDGDGSEEVLTIAGPFILAWKEDGSRFIPGNLLAPKLALNGDTLNFPFAVFGFDTARISSPTAGFGTDLIGADVDADGKKEVFASSNYGVVWGFAPEDLDNDSLADVLPGFPVVLDADPITCLLVGKLDTFTTPVIFAGTSSMRTSNQSKGYLISALNGAVLDSNLFNGSIVGAALDTAGNLFVTSVGNDTVFIQRGFRPVWADTILDSSGISEPVLAESDSGLLAAFTTREGKLHLYNGNGNQVSGFPVNLGTTGLIQPIWSTSALSGQPVILLAHDNQIFAYQTNGFLEPDFPKSIDRQRPLADFVPFLANRTLSGSRMDLLCAATNGNLYFPRMDEREASFYLGTGTETKGLPAVSKSGRIFARGASDGFLYGYGIAGFGFDSLAWRQAHHDFSGSNFLPKTAVPVTPGSTLVAEKSFYNYPNPVVGGKTYLRYRLTSPSEATLTVYDMAGNRIYAPKAVPSEVGNDNEVEVDCGNLASGVYLCRLEVSSAGKKEVVFCKMAVVK